MITEKQYKFMKLAYLFLTKHQNNINITEKFTNKILLA